MDTQLRNRIDRRIVCSIGAVLLLIGLFGLVWRVVGPMLVTNPGPGDVILASILAIVGAFTLAIGIFR